MLRTTRNRERGTEHNKTFDPAALKLDPVEIDTRHAVHAAYPADMSVAVYRQTVLTTFQSVEDQLLALSALQREAQFQTQAVGSAQRAADTVLNQFNAGTVAYTAVIVDIQALLSDQEGLLITRQNQLVAVVTLIEDLGGGWDTAQLP
jgi:outer membrane protein TolC